MPIEVDTHRRWCAHQCAAVPAGRHRVALVDARGRVQLKSVKLGTDFGTSVEVLSGLERAIESC